MFQLPSSLGGNEAQGATRDLAVGQFELGEYRNFVYLIIDWESKTSVWVDPQEEIDAPLEFMTQNQLSLKAILLTHTHFDHVAGLPILLKKFRELPVYVHSLDLHRLSKYKDLSENFKPQNDGFELAMGRTKIRLVHTPGHSAGGCCYYFESKGQPFLLTGDTLFIRDCGRTDLETGSNEQMFESLQKIKQFSPQTILLPGHHYAKECASWLDRELQESPPLRCKNSEELKLLP